MVIEDTTPVETSNKLNRIVFIALNGKGIKDRISFVKADTKKDKET